jgi:predicted histone-like DNA-binding protein
MAVKYCVFKQSYDVSKKSDSVYLARAQAAGVLSFDDLCKKIADRSSATKGDVMLVLDGCINVIKEAIKDGQIVRLGEFGNLNLTISSEGVGEEKEFSAKNITGAKLNFRPGKDLKDVLKDLTYEKTTVRKLRK